MRAPGMSWMRIPLFVWAMVTYAWLLVIVLPSLSAGLTLMLLDRQAGTHFFDPAHGGSPLLYQHVFWFFGHPEVYIMILPAMGMISEILPVFARKPIFGYKAVAISTVGIAFYSLLVWAHHMFAVGLPVGLDIFFMISSMIIAIPTGVKIFNWLATIWRGNISFDTPMLWALGFIGVFTIGGLSGIFLAAFPVDWQLTDTYFVVAHLHYVLFGGSIFAIFGGLYYWWPKMFGRMLDERLGKLHFWLVFVGFNVTFFPQHMLGLLGMPRRVYTYQPGGLWEVYNMTSSIGSCRDGVRDARVRRQRRPDVPERPARRQRPVASRTRSSGTRPRRRRPGTSTRVPVRHERAPAARPAAPARRVAGRHLMGLWARLTALPRSPEPGSPSSPAPPAGARPTACSPASPCRRSPRSPPSPGSRPPAAARVALAALALFGLAALLTGRDVHLLVAAAAFAATARRRARTFRGVEPAIGSRRATT